MSAFSTSTSVPADVLHNTPELVHLQQKPDPNCICRDLQIVQEWVVAGTRRILRKPVAVCRLCGQRWEPKTIANDKSVLYEKVPYLPAITLNERSVAAIDKWNELNIKVDPRFPLELLNSTESSPTLRLMQIGLTPLAMKVDQVGGRHFLFSDIPIPEGLFRNTDVYAMNQLPSYGELFYGMVISERMPKIWVDAIGRHLAGSSDLHVALVCNGMHYVKLFKSFGLQLREFRVGQPDYYAVMIQPPKPIGDGPGSELVDDLKHMGMPNCQQCHMLARRMNEWGVEGCRQRLDSIVEEIMPRAIEWWDNTSYRTKTSAWWKSSESVLVMLDSAVKVAKTSRDRKDGKQKRDAMLRDQVRAQVVRAIDKYEAKTKAKAK